MVATYTTKVPSKETPQFENTGLVKLYRDKTKGKSFSVKVRVIKKLFVVLTDTNPVLSNDIVESR